MTIKQCIDKLNRLKANQYADDLKIGWLNDLDGQIFREIIQPMDEDAEAFKGYTEDTPEDTVLLIGDPYTDIYIHYLSMQIDLYNREINGYNNTLAIYQALWETIRSDWSRRSTHGRIIKFNL